MVPSMVNPPLLTFALGGAMLLSIAGAFAQSPPAASPAQPPGAKPPSANGAKAEHLGDAQGWSAFAETDKNAKACYLVGRPVKTDPENLKRGDVYVYVTHRPAEKSFNVVSFAAGYPYKDATDAELSVDTHKFALFTNKESAWSRDG